MDGWLNIKNIDLCSDSGVLVDVLFKGGVILQGWFITDKYKIGNNMYVAYPYFKCKKTGTVSDVNHLQIEGFRFVDNKP